MLINEWQDQHRYVWGHILSRALLSCVLLVTGISCIASQTAGFFILPLIAGTFAAQYIVDQLIDRWAVGRRTGDRLNEDRLGHGEVGFGHPALRAETIPPMRAAPVYAILDTPIAADGDKKP